MIKVQISENDPVAEASDAQAQSAAEVKPESAAAEEDKEMTDEQNAPKEEGSAEA